MPAKPIPLVVLAGVGATLGAVAVFAKLSEEILEGQSLALDTAGVALARRLRSPLADRVLSLVTATGEPWALCSACVPVGLYWLRQGRRSDVVVLGLALGGSGVVNQVLKHFFHRDRPALQLRRAHASGYSFPSGHAMMTLSVYGTMVALTLRHALLTKQAGAALPLPPVALLCLAVGWSRVYFEVHYPTDVLGAWAAGTAWLTTCALARSGMEPEES
ncbi:MAG: phosphatase PAP2 family protein [Chloroflexota bacterium]|nr:phosphatase PAP2 family protein [Chloroflexota bacterium]